MLHGSLEVDHISRSTSSTHGSFQAARQKGPRSARFDVVCWGKAGVVTDAANFSIHCTDDAEGSMS